MVDIVSTARIRTKMILRKDFKISDEFQKMIIVTYMRISPLRITLMFLK